MKEISYFKAKKVIDSCDSVSQVVLGEIFVKGHEKSVNELLKENGHAYEYHGEKKKVFGS